MSGAAKVIDFDPNLTMCGRVAKFVVRLTFATWEYRKVVEVEMTTNMTGLDLIEYAAEKAWEQLECSEDAPEQACMIMTDAEGNTMHCQDEDERGVDWLYDYIICAEIISVEHVPGKGVAYTPRNKADVDGDEDSFA